MKGGQVEADGGSSRIRQLEAERVNRDVTRGESWGWFLFFCQSPEERDESLRLPSTAGFSGLMR